MRGGEACIVPAYDAAATLADVVAGLRRSVPRARVIVVDDGSRDATRRVAEGGADVVIGFDHNRGKGAALRAGFRAALDGGCSAVTVLDADGQHDPSCVPALVAALTDADIAIGARARGGSAMPWRRRVTNRLSSAAVSWCVGQRIADSQSGFRAFRAEVLVRVAFGRAAGDRYEYETAVLMRAARAGYRIASVPVPTVYPAGAVSHFRPVWDTARVMRTIGRGVVHSV